MQITTLKRKHGKISKKLFSKSHDKIQDYIHDQYPDLAEEDSKPFFNSMNQTHLQRRPRAHRRRPKSPASSRGPRARAERLSLHHAARASAKARGETKAPPRLAPTSKRKSKRGAHGGERGADEASCGAEGGLRLMHSVGERPVRNPNKTAPPSRAPRKAGYDRERSLLVPR